MDEGRATEQADLGGIGRAVAGKAALALDALQHRAFLAADIGAGPATEDEVAGLHDAGVLQLRDLILQDVQDRRIFIAHVDIGFFSLDRPGGDQRAFQEPMGLAFEIVAVLEGAGLAFIAIDREITGRFSCPDELPFPMAGEAGAAEAAKARLVERLHHRLDRELAVPAGGELRIAARFDIGFEGLIGGDHRVRVAVGDRRFDCLLGGMIDMTVADLGDGCGCAATHAGCAHHAHLGGIESLFQCPHQSLRPHHLAGKAITDPNRQAWRRRLPLFDGVEMGVEGRDLVDFGLGKPHLFGERAHMGRGQMAVAVLDQMQEFDQEITVARLMTEENLDFRKRLIIQLPTLGMGSALPLAAAGMPPFSWITFGRCHDLPHSFLGSRTRFWYLVCQTKQVRWPKQS